MDSAGAEQGVSLLEQRFDALRDVLESQKTELLNVLQTEKTELQAAQVSAACVCSAASFRLTNRDTEY